MLIRFCFVALIGLALSGYGYSAQTIRFDNSSSGVTLLNQDRDGLTLSLNIGSIDLDTISITEGTFTIMTVDGFTRSQKIGEPNLPMVNKLISIPFGCELRVDVAAYEVEEILLSEYGFILSDEVSSFSKNTS